MKEKFSVYVLIELMKEFKKKCVERGVTMSKQLEDLIKEWLGR